MQEINSHRIDRKRRDAYSDQTGPLFAPAGTLVQSASISKYLVEVPAVVVRVKGDCVELDPLVSPPYGPP